MMDEKKFHSVQIAKIYVEIEKIRQETTKIQKESEWYLLAFAIGFVVSVIIVTKLFL